MSSFFKVEVWFLNKFNNEILFECMFEQMLDVNINRLKYIVVIC
jgi:hypothetical protein